MSPTERDSKRPGRTNTPAKETTPKSCACSGVRWCAQCRDTAIREHHGMAPPIGLPSLLESRPTPLPSGEFAEPRLHRFDPVVGCVPPLEGFSGLRVYPDFLSQEEARALLDEIEQQPFKASQSGKEKQHFGAKVNFRKRRMNPKAFHGLPKYARRLEAKLRTRAAQDSSLSGEARIALDRALDHFETTDVFVLRYTREASSNLDFHLDDAFAYGEVILDLSLESDSVLTFFRGRSQSELSGTPYANEPPTCVRVAIPARSMAVLYGPARFTWEHAILAYDIEARRTSVTLRTLSQTLRDTPEGQTVVERAQDVLDE